MDKEKFEWPKKAVISLITLWKHYDILYNPRHTFYHNKHARYDALNKVSGKLKEFGYMVGPNDVKHKMEYLRGQYTREVAKLKQRKSDFNDDLDYRPRAYWYNELSFLEDFINIRKGARNFPNEKVRPSVDQACKKIEMPDDVTCDTSQQFDDDVDVAQSVKRSRVDNEDPLSNCSTNDEINVVNEATPEPPNITWNHYPQRNDKDEAFCNFLLVELNSMTNEDIKDELKESVIVALFDAKRKQRQYNNETAETFNNSFYKISQ